MADTRDKNGNETLYRGFPFITNIDKYVQNELANRSIARVRPITPFIKATPGFSIDGEETGKIILKGIQSLYSNNPSLYQFKDLYRPDKFFRPLAGIKSLTVDYLNAYGSVRKAVISWVCHTLEDLEELSPFFLNPGTTMFVEWGWSNYADKIIEDSPKINLKTYLEYVRKKRIESNGNYDGMLGIVINYSFSLNSDGGFDCTTEVVSAGYLMEGITLVNQHTQDVNGNTKPSQNTVSTVANSNEETKEKQEEEKKEKEDQQIRVLKTLQEFVRNDLFKQLDNDYKKYNDINAKHDYFILARDKQTITNLVNKDTGDKSDKNTINDHTFGIISNTNSIGKSTSKNKKQFTDKDKNITIEIPVRSAVYMSWGYIEDHIINKYISIDTEEGNEKLLGFDSRNCKISSHPYLRTTDLGVFILPQSNEDLEKLRDKNNSNESYRWSKTPDFKAGEKLENNNLDFGYVRRLLINAEYFKEVILNSSTLNDAVLLLFAGINDACINYWRFRLIPMEQEFDYREENKEESPPILIKQKIVDINYADRLFENIELNRGLYTFRTKTFSAVDSKTGQKINDVTSVVKNLTFQSKLSSQAAMNVFYSAQSSDGRTMGTPSNNTFQSLYDFSISGKDFSKAKDTFSAGRYKISNPDDNNSSSGSNSPDPGTETDLVLRAQYSYGDALLRYLPYKEKGYWVELTNKYGDKYNVTGIEGMKMAVLTADENGNMPATAQALVPLECELELEGISGIRVGDIFTIDHLPTIYQKHGVFQVIGINENVDKNSWTTKIKGGFRVFRKINYTKATKKPVVYSKTSTIIRSPSTNTKGILTNNYVYEYEKELLNNTSVERIIGIGLPGIALYANSEINAWGNKKENDKSVFHLLQKYDSNLAKDFASGKQPWSAAFISWLVRQVDPSFIRTALHMNYVTMAKNSQNGYKLYAIKDSNKMIKVNIGDIFIRPRSGSTISSHGDIVYKIENNTAYLVGGNLSNGIGITRILLDNDNYIDPFENYGDYKLIVKKMNFLK